MTAKTSTTQQMVTCKDHHWGGFRENGVDQGMGCIKCGAENDKYKDGRTLPSLEWHRRFWVGQKCMLSDDGCHEWASRPSGRFRCLCGAVK